MRARDRLVTGFMAARYLLRDPGPAWHGRPMDLYDVMRTTPAVREFTGEPLPDETLHRILDHARFAPSGGNRQGTRVIVVRDQTTRDRLAVLNEPAVRRYVAQAKAGQGPW